MPVANILDPISSTLPDIWDDPASTEPKLKQEYVQWITHAVYDALEKSGYKDPDSWTDLVLTGSLTTYQYSDASDCDVSLFVHADKVPDWSRAEMIGILTTRQTGRNSLTILTLCNASWSGTAFALRICSSRAPSGIRYQGSALDSATGPEPRQGR